MLEEGFQKGQAYEKKQINIYAEYNRKNKWQIVLCIVFPGCMDMLWVWIHSFTFSAWCFEVAHCQMWQKSPQVSMDSSFIHSFNIYLFRDSHILVPGLDTMNRAWQWIYIFFYINVAQGKLI